MEQRAVKARFLNIDMSTFIITKKSGMTRLFTEEGTVQPVTVLSVVPGEIVQSKTVAKDGYVASVIKAGKTVRECRQDEVSCDLATLEPQAAVQLKGVTKGKGFAGTIKRHNFNRQNKTHGQSDRERAPGSVGGTTNPGRTFKGQRMAGRMGNDRVTAENLEVVVVDAERNLLAVRGSVPGANGGIVIVKPARVRR